MPAAPRRLTQEAMTDAQILVRILAAAAATSLLGLERSRRRKGIGARTFGLIGVGAAAAGVMAVQAGAVDLTAVGRTLQGVMMGIGFLGAGAILHPVGRKRALGVTTAAAIWVAAVAGFAAGLAEWVIVASSVGFSLLLLVLPEPLDVEEPRPSRRRRAAEAQPPASPPAA
jgi:putative Mg2+ transporter-C (MgtC) family protein